MRCQGASEKSEAQNQYKEKENLWGETTENHKTQAILTANCFWERSTAETEKNKEGEAVHSRTRQSIHSEMSDAPQRTIVS